MKWLGVSLLCLLIGLAWWAGSGDWGFKPRTFMPAPELVIEVIPQNIDTYMVDAQIRNFDESGQLSHQIDTPYIEHWQKEDVSQLQQPEVEWFQTNASAWSTAQRGTLEHQSNELLLQGEVYLLQSRYNGNPMTMASDWMRMNLDSETAESPATLVQSFDWITHAASMQAELKPGRYFLTQICTYYDRSDPTD